MTQILTIGIDPGLTGALAALADGVPIAVYDLPVRTVGKWGELDAGALAALIRAMRGGHPGAYVSACVEQVQARPADGGTSAFRFGSTYGAIRGVLESLGIPYSRAIPAVWKRHFGLIGCEKDVTRQVAIQRFPAARPDLTRKKDHGRADALMLALFHEAKHIGARERAA